MNYIGVFLLSFYDHHIKKLLLLIIATETNMRILKILLFNLKLFNKQVISLTFNEYFQSHFQL